MGQRRVDEVAARREGRWIWADGGVRYPRDVAIALELGCTSAVAWGDATVDVIERTLYYERMRANEMMIGIWNTGGAEHTFTGKDWDLAMKRTLDFFNQYVKGGR